MKKNLKFVALTAVALLCACGNKDGEATTITEMPKVKIAAVVTESVSQTQEYTTTVEAMNKNSIIPNSPLRIEKILVEVGDYVKKGQELVRLDASTLEQLNLQIGQLALQIEQQEMQAEQLEIDFKRVEELYKIGGTSKAEYDNMKTQVEVSKKGLEVSRKNVEVSRKNIENRKENTVLLSPIDGIVTARNYDDGDMYGGQAILVVEQISPVKMKINISESDYSRVNNDLDVKLKFEAFGNEEFKGNINIVYPTINNATHTFPVEIIIPNEDLKVRPGMYGKAIVNFGSVEHVVVPDEAVMKQAGSGDYYVYTYENGKVYNNKVTLGSRMDNRYELIDGIAPGSQVVIAGKESLRNGIEVEVIE